MIVFILLTGNLRIFTIPKHVLMLHKFLKKYKNEKTTKVFKRI